MHIDAGDLDPGQLRRHAHRPPGARAIGNAELVFGFAGRDFLVGLGVHVRIDADRDAAPRTPLRDRDFGQCLELRFGFHVEAQDAAVERERHLVPGLADAREDDPLAGHARRKRAAQFAFGDDVHAGAELAQRPQHRLVGIRLHGIADERIPVGERFGEDPVVPLQRSRSNSNRTACRPLRRSGAGQRPRHAERRRDRQSDAWRGLKNRIENEGRLGIGVGRLLVLAGVPTGDGKAPCDAPVPSAPCCAGAACGSGGGFERAATAAGGKAENDECPPPGGRGRTTRLDDIRCSETWPHHNDIREPMREATLRGKSRHLGASHPIVMANRPCVLCSLEAWAKTRHIRFMPILSRSRLTALALAVAIGVAAAGM